MKWQDRRLLDLFGIEHPILQAPMAGVTSPQMAIATSEAGALGSIAGAMLTPDGLRQEFQMVKQGTARPFNVNFFVHKPPTVGCRARCGVAQEARARIYDELGVAPDAKGPSRAAFDAAVCDLVLEFMPKVASFHFGLPDTTLMQAPEGGGHPGHRFGDDGRGGALAGGRGRRCRHRAGRRGRRSSRHVPGRRHLAPGRHDGAGAAGRGCGEGAGDRRRRNRRRSRHRGGAGARCGRRCRSARPSC